ncbi:MAG: UDP-N-acetylmuramate dehydrogenase [Candidatus Taylorbacteria bacterium]|nr:UDP-N-acetylmuramate dehydrogenase [Candidatus Taylorbacteria bacterium]
MIIKEKELLKTHTTFQTGGPASFFIEARTENDIKEAAIFFKQKNLPVFVLGLGSNLLVSDNGFKGIIINILSEGIKSEVYNEDVLVIAEAGERWDSLVGYSVWEGLYGLENMSAIPGTVGGGVAGNIGAYGAEVKDRLLWVDALDMRSGNVKRFSNADCVFTYRNSFFKTEEGKNNIIIRAGFLLSKNGKANIAYKDLSDFFAGKTSVPNLKEIRDAIISIRQSKLPDWTKVGTAGSFFKNPTVSEKEFSDLKTRFPEIPGRIEDSSLSEKRVKLSLGWILDKICGLKGMSVGRVGTYGNQALVIVNEGGTANEVLSFAGSIEKIVKEKTGITIEREVELVGF